MKELRCSHVELVLCKIPVFVACRLLGAGAAAEKLEDKDNVVQRTVRLSVTCFAPVQVGYTCCCSTTSVMDCCSVGHFG